MDWKQFIFVGNSIFLDTKNIFTMKILEIIYNNIIHGILNPYGKNLEINWRNLYQMIRLILPLFTWNVFNCVSDSLLGWFWAKITAGLLWADSRCSTRPQGQEVDFSLLLSSEHNQNQLPADIYLCWFLRLMTLMRRQAKTLQSYLGEENQQKI